MSLPGLGLAESDHLSHGAVVGATAQSQSSVYDLQKESEWRFEVALGRSVSLKVTAGQAELYGSELVLSHVYTLSHTKAAIFTWTGCSFEVTSDHGPLSHCLTSEYVAEETSQHEYFNTNAALAALRQEDLALRRQGPRVLVVGPENSGKTSLIKTLAAYDIRRGSTPLVVNVDPTDGLLTIPGTLSAAVFKTLLDVEEGWGTAPINGPNGDIPVKVPLVYYFGSVHPLERDGDVYKKQISRLALAVSAKMTADPHVGASGCLLDTPGALVGAKAAQTGYAIVEHLVSEFGVNAIICLGSERLYSDMTRKFDKKPSSKAVLGSATTPEQIAVIKLSKSGGVAERDVTWMRAIRDLQVRRYFYGDPKLGAGISLQPRQQQIDFADVTIWRRIAASGTGLSLAGVAGGNEDEFLPGGGDDDTAAAPQAVSSVPLPASQIFEKLAQPLPALRNCVLAIMDCEREPDPSMEQETLRDCVCIGFLYVTDIDEARRKISLLKPQAGSVPERALIWSESMDGILNLV